MRFSTSVDGDWKRKSVFGVHDFILHTLIWRGLNFCFININSANVKFTCVSLYVVVQHGIFYSWKTRYGFLIIQIKYKHAYLVNKVC